MIEAIAYAAARRVAGFLLVCFIIGVVVGGITWMVLS